MKCKSLISMVLLVFAATNPVSAHPEEDKSTGQKLNEARLEGQIWTTYTLNRHLNPFELGVDVEGESAVLTGEVEDPVQKELAEQIALGIKGIEDVDNRIEVVQGLEVERQKTDGDERSFGDRVSDLSTTASIKSKLLWNRNTSGMSVNVSTENGHVILEGTADSETGKDLAGRLASNTDGVHKVENRLVVEHDADSEVTQKRKAAGDAVSDGWITTKVKSTLLFSRNVSGMDINVDTKDGVVSLKGAVASGSEKELAVKLAEDIRGVIRVDASGLEVVG